ncbi:hypothetical protein Aperf_G00000068154 [Anoplocephala perfoliata]
MSFKLLSCWRDVYIFGEVRMDGGESVDSLSFQLSVLPPVEEVSASVAETSDNPRLLLYKNKRYALDQERRWRSELSSIQRNERRKATFDSNRNTFCSDSDKKTNNPWSEKPDKTKARNFESEYLFKLCPKGRHVCVVAGKGQTNVYSRSGVCLATLLTRLPGGGLGQSSSMMHRYETILDCIMLGVPSATMTHQEESFIDVVSASSPKEKLVFMVLDLVSLKSTSYSFITFSERCQWLENFHRELIEACESTDLAQFKVIPAHSCYSESMISVFSSPPPFELDGVLFYHSCVSYRRGPTPLVGWLKPYMLPEWFPYLSPHINSTYLAETPPDYKDYLTDIERYKDQSKVYATTFKGRDKKKGHSSPHTEDIEMEEKTVEHDASQKS